MVRKNFGRQKSSYRSKKAVKWAGKDRKKRLKAQTYQRNYPLFGQLYGGQVGVENQIAQLVKAKREAKRRELRYLIRQYPRYYLSQGRKKYDTVPRGMDCQSESWTPLVHTPSLLNILFDESAF